MAFALDANGQVVEVPDAPQGAGSTVNPALEQQRSGKLVQLVDRAGTVYDVDSAGAEQLVQSGRYELASPEAVSAWDKQSETPSGLAALGEAAAAGAYDAAVAPVTLLGAGYSAITGNEDPTKPLSGRAIMRELAYLGGEFTKGEGRDTAREYEAESRERARSHPVLSAIGTIGGSLAGGLGLAGGAKLAGGAVAAKTGSALLGGVTAGALEGAALGGAGAREEAFIKDEALTAESVLAGMGWGALIGGGVGLTVGAGQRLFGRAGSRGATPLDSPRITTGTTVAEGAADDAGKGGLRGWLNRYAEERTTKALGARGTDIRKLGKTAPKAEAEMRRMARDVLEHKLDDGTPVFRAVQSQEDLVQRLGQAQQETGAKLSALREEVGSFLETKAKDLRPDTSAIADRIQKEVTAPLMASAVPDVQAKAVPVQRMTDAVRSLALGPDAPPGDALGALTKLRQDLDSIIYPKPTGPGLPPLPPNHVDQLVKVRGIIEDEIEATMDKAVSRMDPAKIDEYANLKGKWRSFREASQIAGKAQLQDLGNRVIGSPTDYLTGAAVLAGDMAAGGGLSLVKGAAAAAAHKAVREHSSAMLAVLADRMARNVDQKISRGVSGFFRRSLERTTAPAGVPTRSAPRLPGRVSTPTALEVFRGKEDSTVKAYRKRVAQLDEATRDYGSGVRMRTQEALGNELAQRAPKLAGNVVSTATRAAVFLQSKRPEPATNLRSLTPHASAPVPSDYEMSKFARYWNTVASPLSAVRDLENGTLTHEQVEALQVVYPRLYRSIQEHVMTKLREADAKGIEVPYQAKLQLDLLLNLGGAGEPTATPDFMLRFQEMSAAVAEQQQAAPRPQPISMSERYSTRTHELEKGI